MNDDAVFLLDSSNRLTVAPATQHETEADFQEMLETHPRLLAGARIRPDDPLRWLLVKREASVPDTDSGQGRWSLDHLFIDQDGTPTLVEVKRASDTRLRREVVGQMFDYAANAQLHWSADGLRALATATHGSLDALNEAIVGLLDLDGDDDRDEEIDRWWAQVEDRLQRGAMRLLLVADRIPTELKRIIEFLNEQMQNIEVLGIELSLYADANVRVLVPRVLGQTEAAVAQKSKGSLKSTKKLRSINDAYDAAEPDVREFMQWLVREGEADGFTVRLGTRGFSVGPDNRQTGAMYCAYPARDDGTDDAYAEIYFWDKAFTADEIEAHRQKLIALDDRLRLGGRFTVRITLSDAAACAVARRAVRTMMDHLRGGPRS